MNVVILTPIAIEFNRVRAHLSANKSSIIEGSLYETGQFKGRYHDYHVILHETGPKNTTIALATEKAIRLFQPAVILLVGVAGGIKKVNIGDLAIGIMAYGYESGTETEAGPAARPHTVQFSKELIEVARLVSRSDRWRKLTSDGAPNSKIVFGPIASGDKVIATTTSPLYVYLKKHFNDTIAIEMESIGFGQAVLPFRNVHAIIIRGISDLLDNKSASDSTGSQNMAAERASAFAMEMLNQLDCTLLTVPHDSITIPSKGSTTYKDVGIIVDGNNSEVNMKGKYVSGRDIIIKK
jgi:nucleoside phosphorylase